MKWMGMLTFEDNVLVGKLPGGRPSSAFHPSRSTPGSTPSPAVTRSMRLYRLLNPPRDCTLQSADVRSPSDQKNFKPDFPVLVRAHPVKQLIVFLPIQLEIEIQVQDGLTERPGVAQQQRNQQAAKSAVPVQEWMNRFELHVDERGLYENRPVFALAVHEFFECAHALYDFVGRRWNKRRITWPCASNPVLGNAKFPGALLATAPFAQENLVNFSHEAQREALRDQPSLSYRRDAVGGRSGEHRDRQQAGADDAGGE